MFLLLQMPQQTIARCERVGQYEWEHIAYTLNAKMTSSLRMTASFGSET